MTSTILFEEKQYFDQPWLRGLLIAFVLFDAVAYKHGLVVPFGALLALTFIANLETQVTEEGIRFRFFPFMSWREIPLNDIQELYIRQYRPIVEYGGWGIRWGFGGRAYNVKGKEGLQIVLKNGSSVLIGTQDAASLAKTLKILES